MNAKLVMEVTIAELVNPLLYERLNACATPRERAAVFRACAEAHLRAGLTGSHPALGSYAANGLRNATTTAESWRQDSPDTRGATDATRHETSSAIVSTASTTATANDPGVGFQALRTGDRGNMSAAFGDAMGSGLSDFY